MPRKHFQIPEVQSIKDPVVRRAIQRIAAEMTGMTDPSSTDRLPTVKDLNEAGVLGIERSGRLYSVAGARTAPAPVATGGPTAGTRAYTLVAPISIGTVPLGDIPSGAIITLAWYNVTTALASATNIATVQLGIETDDPAGIVSGVAINDPTTPWASGYHAGIPDGVTPATFTQETTAARSVIAAIGAEALTAGELQLFVSYVLTGA